MNKESTSWKCSFLFIGFFENIEFIFDNIINVESFYFSNLEQNKNYIEVFLKKKI